MANRWLFVAHKEFIHASNNFFHGNEDPNYRVLRYDTA